MASLSSFSALFGFNSRSNIQTAVQSAKITLQDRYNQVQGKSETELSAMGIQFIDGTYFKDGVAWLSKNDIDNITGRYSALLDSNGNYIYPIDIPQDIMSSVVNQYGSTLTKDELIKTARDVYQKTGTNLSDTNIQSAINDTHQQATTSNTSLGNKMQQAVQSSADKAIQNLQPTSGSNPNAIVATNNTGTNKSKSFFSTYGIWLIAGGIIIVAGFFLLKPKKN